MTNELIPFRFKTHDVRTVIIDGEPWFVAKDVCDVLRIANSRDAMSRIPDKDKGVGLSDTLGGVQTVLASVKATSGGQRREVCLC